MDYKEKFISLINDKTLPIEQRKKLEEIYNSCIGTDDERIRKALIKFHKDTIAIYGINGDDIVAWLEKQGNKPVWTDNDKIMVSTLIRDVEQITYINEEGKNKRLDWLNSLPQGKTALEAIHKEKIDNVNKVEPKFHEGDWIACEELGTALIVNIDDDRYEVEFIDGNKGFPHIDYIDRLFHLWTIEDAKDGDILVSQYNLPFIYNGHHDSFNCGSYCGIKVKGDFKVAEYKCHWTKKVNIHPANKEQSDLLFAKMKEAGYEWDEDKKELKRVEKDGEKKEKWSDEDEQYLLICKNALRKYQVSDKWDAEIISKWLEDKLKQRDQKPKWTEEDERGSDETIELLEYFINYTPEFRRPAIRRNIDWLKSIKQRMEEQ